MSVGNTRNGHATKYICVGAGLLVLFWFFSPFLQLLHHDFIHWCYPADKLPLSHEEYGTFGDSFGHINSLFTGAALLLVILSVYLQRLELIQFTKTFGLDSFERTFFNMINLFNDQRDDVGTDKFRGSKYITHLLSVFQQAQMDSIGRRKDVANQTPACLSFMKSVNRRDDRNTILFFKAAEGMGRDAFSGFFTASLKATNEYDIAERYVQIIVKTLNVICSDIERVCSDIVDEKERAVRVKQMQSKYGGILWSQLSDHEIEYLYIHAYGVKDNVKALSWRLDWYLKNISPGVEVMTHIEEKCGFIPAGWE